MSAYSSPVCSRCGGERDRLDQRYCSACHALYMRLWRLRNIPRPARDRLADLAREIGIALPEDFFSRETFPAEPLGVA